MIFQTRQPIFVQLLNAAVQVVTKCNWLSVDQRVNVESCIRTLSEVAKSRAIAIPTDLDQQVKMLFDKANLISMKTGNKWISYSRAKYKREPSQLSLHVRMDRHIIEGLQDIVSVLEGKLKPLVQSELSVLVDTLYRPELLFPVGTEARRKCENGGFIRRLIAHTSKLLEEKEDSLCVKILQTLREMMAVDVDYGEKGDILRKNLLQRYFGKVPLPPMQCIPTTSQPVSHGPGSKFLSRAQMTLHAVQCHLDNQRASKLIVDLVIKSSTNSRIFAESVELGIALLEGGNQEIQVSLYKQLKSGEVGQNFFRVFFETMNEAQAEIKSTVTVNTSDIAAKANEDSLHPGTDVSNHIHSIKSRNGKQVNGNLVLTEEMKEELEEASVSTQQAFISVRAGASGEDVLLGPNGSTSLEEILEKSDKSKQKIEENKLSPKVAVMKPILRFLQLLCENHNMYLQNLLRDQYNKTNYNLVSETLILLDVICGSTTGGLGLLGLYINENNVLLINQILETLTEYCQVRNDPALGNSTVHHDGSVPGTLL